MTTINLSKLSRVHFVGIGGVAMSAVARMLLGRGVAVSGSDRSSSPLIEQLARAGAAITIGHSARAIPADCDLVVYTVAIPANNAELVEAARRTLPTATYPEMLEIISAEKYTVAVAGTHGKTTTTAMLGSILIQAGLDPSVLVGGLMLDPRRETGAADFEKEGTNFILGKSDYFVVEADEYKKSFLHLKPRLLIINNIDADHLDFYKDLADVQSAFAELAERVPADGFIICDPSDAHVAPVIKKVAGRIVEYPQQPIPTLRIPGAHNRANAMAAAAAAKILGASENAIAEGLKNFPGSWRRFQYKGETSSGALVYDDYAHNPPKVAAAIAGARERHPGQSLTVVFQPHLYSRTKHLFKEFVRALAGADHVVLLPIYAAREQLDPSISSDMLAGAISEAAPKVTVTVCANAVAAKKYLIGRLVADDVVVTTGAGDVTELADILIE